MVEAASVAVRGVEGVDPTVARADVNHAVRDGWGRLNGAAIVAEVAEKSFTPSVSNFHCSAPVARSNA